MVQKAVRDLKVGDVIEVWWQPNRDVITGIVPYAGPLAYLWPEGAVIFHFALLKSGMTAGLGDIETVVASPANT